MYPQITNQATTIYVSSSETALKGELMWVVMDFWAHRVTVVLFAGWIVWGCVALWHMEAVYLFISNNIFHESWDF